MEVLFKYKIGQKVKLKSNNLRNWQYRDEAFAPLVGKEVTIWERGFQIEEVIGNWQKPNFMDKYHIEIIYYIKEDIVFDKERQGRDDFTRIPEDCLEGEDTQDLTTVRFFSSDGRVLEPNMHVYGGLVDYYNNVRQANTRFSFCTYGRITGFKKNWERANNIWDKERLHEQIQIEREFLGYFAPENGEAPKPRHDCAAIGYRSWWETQYKSIHVNPPCDYVKLYVNTALSNEFNGMSGRYPFDDWEIRSWLDHMGILEKTKELYDTKAPEVGIKSKTEKEEKEKFEKKANDILAQLSPEERKKLKALL